MKIFVDTNILISALACNGKIGKLFDFLCDSEHKICVSEYVENELKDVFRLKWKNRSEELIKKFNQLNLTRLKSTTEIYTTQIRDIKDTQVLNDAIYHKVDILLTGDKDFAEVKITAEKPKIMTPSELAEMLEIEV